MRRDTEHRGAAARELLCQLYPSPHEVDSNLTDSTRARFLAVPNASAPRLLVDARSPNLGRQALRSRTFHRRSARLARSSLALLIRTGVYRHLPGCHINVRGPAEAPSVEDPLRRILHVPSVRLAVPIGPRRANRKPVLQVSDSRGQVLAFVKVGHNVLTDALVRRESASLQQLALSHWHSVVIPRVIVLEEWRDLTLLVLEPLAMPHASSRGLPHRERVFDIVDEIATHAGVSTVRWGDHPLRVLLQRALTCKGPAATPWLCELIDLPTDELILTGAWHGDLNPGNIALSEGRIPVWDWERFQRQVPVGFDLLHHDLQAAITVRQTAPVSAVLDLLRASPALLARWGYSREAAVTVCRAYFITLAERYLADDQAAAGASLGRVDEWLLPGLRAAP